MRTTLGILILWTAWVGTSLGGTVIKIATVAPRGTTWVNELEKTAESLRASTGGKLTLRIYAGGVLGDEADVVRKIRVGQLQAAAFTGMGLGELLLEVRVLESPFLVHTDKEVEGLVTKLTPRLKRGFDSRGFELLGFVPVGFVYLFSAGPIGSIEDLRKAKVWVWDGDPLARALFRAAGVPGIPLALPDVLTSLQTRLVDTVYGTPLGVIALQWHTRLKWRTDIPITHVMGGVVITKRAIEAMPPERQATLRDAFSSLCRNLAEAGRTENSQALQALESQGIRPVAVGEESRAAFLALGPLVAEAEAGRLFPKELLEDARAAVSKPDQKP